jgi:hypothetical protein
MASRLTSGVSSSQNGLSFGAGQLATTPTVDVNISVMPAVGFNSPLATALNGATIRSLTVSGGIEVWSDGVVWDLANNRALMCGIDYDPSLFARSV